MRRLILVRHAKTQPAAASDFERLLTDSGEQEAALVAGRLTRGGNCPDRLLTSPAARARATAAIFADACGLAPAQLVAVPELYLADPDTLLAAIGRHGGDAETLMLVAHNPGISELAAGLSGQPLGELPTAAVVQLAWPGQRWDAAPASARLLHLDHPLAALLGKD